MEAIIQIIRAKKKKDKKLPNYVYTLDEVFLVFLDLDNYIHYPFRHIQFEILSSTNKQTKR